MDNNLIREIQMQVLSIFKDFTKLCEDNSLNYYLLGGTMLGAIRHQGFIPWDDDMDVGMPRNDYEKFINIVNEHINKKEWRLSCAKFDTKISYDFAKLKKKIIVNNKEYEIFLDIFPLDGCNKSTPKGIKKYYNKFNLLRIIKNSHFMQLENKNIIKKVIVLLARMIPIETYMKKMDKYLLKNSFEDSVCVGNFSGHWCEKEIMHRNIYGTPTLVKFEDGMYYGVEQPHLYLKNMYGDYMKMPPVEEQQTHLF